MAYKAANGRFFYIFSQLTQFILLFLYFLPLSSTEEYQIKIFEKYLAIGLSVNLGKYFFAFIFHLKA